MPGRTIAVLSGKGGTGKTITTINLGLAFQEFGYQTVLIDADQTSPDLSLLLGLNPDQDYTLQDVLKGEEVLRSICMHPSGLMVIPTQFVSGGGKINKKKFEKALKRLREIILIDCPPGFYSDVKDIIEVVDEILVLTNPEVSSIIDALRVISEIETMDKKDKLKGIALNQIEDEDFEVNEREIEFLSKLPIISKIPNDKEVKKGISKQTPVIEKNPYSKSSIEFKKLASQFLGKKYNPPLFSSLRSFFHSIIHQ